MNVLLSILNKIRFSSVSSIDKNNVFSVGSYKHLEKGYALLKNGERIADNLIWVSSNFLSDGENSQKDYIIAKPLAETYLIFNKNGVCLTPEGLHIFNTQYDVPKDYPYMYGVDDEYGDILVKSNYNNDMFLIYPHTKNLSRTFTEISSYDENAQRIVKTPDLFRCYIDRKGKRVSHYFIKESENYDQNGNKTQVVINSRGNEVQVLVDKNHEWITPEFYDRIIPMGNYYIAAKRKSKTLIKLDCNGKPIAQVSFNEFKNLVKENKLNIQSPISITLDEEDEKI